MPVQLGPFEIDHPFILAPMAGITNSPFRRLMRELRSAVVISELVSANGIQYGGQRTLDLLRYHPSERVVGIQLFGETPENLVLAAKRVEDDGADFVDLNLGCPVQKVVRKGAGCALARDSIALGKVLSEMKKAIRIPLTIKIRTGWDHHHRNALDVVKAASDAGVSWVAIHGRTRSQGYSGDADWEFIGEVKAKSPLPIIGNGDVQTPDQANERLNMFGVDAVMIGRAALRNPFIFRQSEDLWKGKSDRFVPSSEDYLGLLERQRVLLNETFGEKSGLHAKKFLSWYSSGFPGSSEFRKTIFSTSETSLVWNLGFSFFEKSIRNRDMSFLAEPFLMGGHG